MQILLLMVLLIVGIVNLSAIGALFFVIIKLLKYTWWAYLLCGFILLTMPNDIAVPLYFVVGFAAILVAQYFHTKSATS